MITSNEPRYDVRKPPVILPVRKHEFICEECGKPGWGPLNARVHPGKCRAKRDKKKVARAAERQKKRKLAARKAAEEKTC